MKAALFAAACALLAALPIHAAVLHVCPDGTGDYPDLHAAVQAATDGDEIELCDGVFEGLVNLELDLGPKSLTFRSLHGYESTTIYGLIFLPKGVARGLGPWVPR